MNSSGRITVFWVFCLLSGWPVFGQNSVPVPTGMPVQQDTGIEKIPVVVTNQPYSAVSETQVSQTLANGTVTHRAMSSMKTYRDSSGRTRVERYRPNWAANGEPPSLLTVMIRDPVAGVWYVLNPRNHTARELRLFISSDNDTNGGAPSDLTMRRRTPPTRPNHPRAKITVQDLGTQVMDGLVVHGKRVTMAFPVDAQGNDQPFETVTERWFCEELETYILIKTLDPRSGESTIKTTILTRSEPDSSLFQVPADYAITNVNVP